MKRVGFVVTIGAVLALSAGPAGAHGELQGTDPAKGASLGSVPDDVSLTLTEAPGPGSTLEVTDGCERAVAGRVSRDGSDLQASVKGGEPGRWSMTYRAVSSVDGHVTKGKVRFKVTGERDCSEPQSAETDVEIGGGEDTQVANEDRSEGGGFPLIQLALGTVVLVGIALLLRASTSSG